MSMTDQALIETLRSLPAPQRAEVEDFVEFLVAKTRKRAVLDRLLALAPALDAAGVSLAPKGSTHSSSPLEFDPLAAACADDWDEWKDEGYDVVDALPPVQSDEEDEEEEEEVEEEEAGAAADESESEDDDSGSQATAATTEAAAAAAPAAAAASDDKEASSAPVAMEEEKKEEEGEAAAANDEAPAAGWASF